MSAPWVGPDWLPLAVFGYALLLSVAVPVGLRSLPLTLEDARWIVAACLGSAWGALLAPDPWIAGCLLTWVLGIPCSLLWFHRVVPFVAHPVAGSVTALGVAIWIAGLGLVTHSLRATDGVPILLALLLAGAACSSAIGAWQVWRGVPSIVWKDAGYGTVGEMVRLPTAWLHNTWKPAAINAMVLPICVGLLWCRPWLGAVGLVVGALLVWHLWAAEGRTCQIAALAGGIVALILLQAKSVWALGLIPAVALSSIAHPAILRAMQDNPRWEAWRIGWEKLRQSFGLGGGIGVWRGMHIRTAKEGNRIWHAMHNDWAETWLESGPLPILCAVGYLGAAMVRAAADPRPLVAGLAGSLIAGAVLALGYMPWRVWPINLYGLGLIAGFEALTRR